MAEGVDYSFARPSPTGLVAAGKRFAMRYVGPYCDNSPKGLDVAEAKSLIAAGLSIVYLVEGIANGALAGRAAGVAHAQSALSYVRHRGWPDDQPFYYAVDFDVTAAQWPAVKAYLDGASSVHGGDQTGIYGGLKVMLWAARDNAARWFFQTYAWSGGEWFGGNDVEQYDNGVTVAGGDVDLCRSMQPDFGQWPRAATGGDDMQADERAAVMNSAAFAYACENGAETVFQYDSRTGNVIIDPVTGKGKLFPMGPYWARIAAEVAKSPGAVGPAEDHTHTVNLVLSGTLTGTAIGSTGPAQPLDAP
jgi:hypothetical protein